MWISIAAGAAVAAANGLVAWLAIRWAWSRPHLLMPVVLGSMAVRLVAVGLATGLVLALTDVDPLYFVGALILVFLVIQVLEIIAVLRRAAAERQARETR